MYLSDVEAGGSTVFPEVGIDVLPHRGNAVYFAYCSENGTLDTRTLHGGSPVGAGEKWIATKWFRQRRYFGSAVWNEASGESVEAWTGDAAKIGRGAPLFQPAQGSLRLALFQINFARATYHVAGSTTHIGVATDLSSFYKKSKK
jgi:hypothetical protein